MLKKNWDTGFLQEIPDEVLKDRMDIFLLANSRILGAIIQGTTMVNQMRANHELGIIETLALGHAYLAAGLLTRSLTGEERILLQIDSSGPLGGLTAEANAHGEIRGYLKNKSLDITAPVNSFNLAPFLGIGFLKITKYLKRLKQPFTGQVVLQTSNLAEDLAYYFRTSEQIPTAFHLSIKFDREGRVTGAGGLLLQALPGTDQELLDDLTNTVQGLPSLGNLLEAGMDCTSILQHYFISYNSELLAHNPVQFYCHCSKEHFGGYLVSLPVSELEDMLEKGPFPIVITCHNCNSTYEYGKEEIRAMLMH